MGHCPGSCVCVGEGSCLQHWNVKVGEDGMERQIQEGILEEECWTQSSRRIWISWEGSREKSSPDRWSSACKGKEAGEFAMALIWTNLQAYCIALEQCFCFVFPFLDPNSCYKKKYILHGHSIYLDICEMKIHEKILTILHVMNLDILYSIAF